MHARRIVPHLEGGQHVAIGEPEEAVGMAHARLVAEFTHHPRPGFISKIEDEALSAPESVNEQLAVGSQLVLRVMRPVPASHRHGRDDRAIPRAVRLDIEDREEVGGHGVGGAGPEIQVLAGSAGSLRHGLGSGVPQEHQKEGNSFHRSAPHELGQLVINWES
jgi:hypothetical protein